VTFSPLRDRRAFEAGIRTRPVSSTPLFVLHHPTRLAGTKLSTQGGQARTMPVDNSGTSCADVALLGIVIPKRHARRAVTRNAIRRLVRAAVSGLGARLPPGVWLVRLRASPAAHSPAGAAVSAALKAAVRTELGRLFAPVLVAPAGQAVGHPVP
jgi:ribonuclease P protein component